MGNDGNDAPPSGIRVSDTLSIPESAIAERFVRASGPGGQNVNKVATAVELRFDLAAAGLADAVNARLRALAGKRIGADGVLMIDSREHRSQARNRTAARERLRDLLRRAASPPKKRRPTRPSRTAREKRLAAKSARGHVKAGRSRIQQDDDR
jgi:ribosome-associated protein